jgi:hypothetical protein
MQQVQHDDQQNPTSASQSPAGAWHEINKILRRQLRNNRPWFLVEWKDGTTSWVKHRDVSDFAVKQFYANNPRRKTRRK